MIKFLKNLKIFKSILKHIRMLPVLFLLNFRWILNTIWREALSSDDRNPKIWNFSGKCTIDFFLSVTCLNLDAREKKFTMCGDVKYMYFQIIDSICKFYLEKHFGKVKFLSFFNVQNFIFSNILTKFISFNYTRFKLFFYLLPASHFASYRAHNYWKLSTNSKLQFLYGKRRVLRTNPCLIWCQATGV